MPAWMLATGLAMAQAPAPPPSSTSSTSAQSIATPTEPPMKLLLDGTTLRYGTSSSGLSYTVLFDHPNNRKRIIFIGVKPSTIEDLAVHTIYTTVWTGNEPPSQDVMKKALLSTKKFGFFYLFQDAKSVWAIRFGANAIMGPTKTETLRDLIYFVNQVGEESELALSAPK